MCNVSKTPGVYLGVLLFLLTFLFSTHSAFAEVKTVRIYGSEGDGDVKTSPYPGTWDNQHDDVVGRAADYTDETIYFKSGSFYTPTDYLGIVRAFTVFDTSEIPDGAEILSANLNLYIQSVKDEFNDEYAYFSVFEGRQASPFEIVNSDIDNCGNAITNPSKGSDDFDLTYLPEGEYVVIDLNSTGLDWISDSGFTKLCLREGHDIENVETVKNVYTGTWGESWVYFAGSEASGTSTDPYLEVTYEYEPEPVSEYPLYTQIISDNPSVSETASWANEVYANGAGQTGTYPCGLTIADCGCAITSLVMAGRYAGIEEDVAHGDVNPKNINEYLDEVGGYTSNGSVVWLAAQAYLGEVVGGQITSRFSTPEFTSDMGDVAAALEEEDRIVLGFDSGHFVWVTEKTVDGYLLNDPVWYLTETADDVVESDSEYVRNYDNTFDDARIFTVHDEPVLLGNGVEAYLSGTAELLYRNTSDEVVGYVDGDTIVDLAGAWYAEEGVISLVGAGGTGKHLLVPGTEDSFSIEVIGTGLGEYEVEFFVLTAEGEMLTYHFSGYTFPGVSTTFVFDLDSGGVAEESITYEQFLIIMDAVIGDDLTSQQRAFFEKWAAKIFDAMEAKTVSQALQAIETFGKLLIAKKVDSPILLSVLDKLSAQVE
ncbi:hypothetical protein H6786_02700 [Candidatus Nomurabacteria bacterium]|nr:hypothetical protein [Candidatus Nomurabacteria bacterium]